MRDTSDLPLWRDPSTKFIPWVVAFMTYLATLSFVGALMLSNAIELLDPGSKSRLTIEVPPFLEDIQTQSLNYSNLTSHQLMSLLKKETGVKSVRLLSRAEVLDSIKPWFDDVNQLDSLPLSTFVELEVDPAQGFNFERLKTSVLAAVPNAKLESHDVWKSNLLSILYTVKSIGLLVVFLVILSAFCVISFVSQTGLIIHRNIIEILHLIGARNKYIAQQFQSHAFKLGCLGSLIGVIFIVLTFQGIRHFTGDMDISFFERTISAWDLWAIVFFMPALIIGFMMLSARLTVMILLRRI